MDFVSNKVPLPLPLPLPLSGLPAKELLTALERHFPNTLPDPMTDPREVDMRIGEQRVLNLLRRVAREQSDISNKEVLRNV